MTKCPITLNRNRGKNNKTRNEIEIFEYRYNKSSTR